MEMYFTVQFKLTYEDSYTCVSEYYNLGVEVLDSEEEVTRIIKDLLLEEGTQLDEMPIIKVLCIIEQDNFIDLLVL